LPAIRESGCAQAHAVNQMANGGINMTVQIRRNSFDASIPLRKNSCKARTRYALQICGCALLGALLLTPSQRASASGERAIDENVAQPAGAYHLGQGDKVRLKVFAWRAAKDEIFAWSPLNAEFSVGVSGAVSLPLLGDVQAAGLSPGELSRSIAYRLQDRFGLVERPEISVEMAQYRPFYIVGNVAHPGEYAFRPGITVLQAMSIAGGEARSLDALRLRREIISSSGDLDVLKSERASLMARKTRLNAELSASDTLVFSPLLTSDPDARAILMQEQQLFRARKSAFDSQLAALTKLNNYLHKEADSAQAQLTTHEREVELVQEELNSIKALVAKKLAIQSRRVELERNFMQVQGERLRLESGVRRVNQEISKTQLSMVELRNNRSQEITTELAATEAKLDQTNRRIETTNDLLADSISVAPRLATLVTGKKKGDVQYQIIRISSEGNVTQFPATELTTIQPGDTIKIDQEPDEAIMASSPPADKSLALNTQASAPSQGDTAIAATPDSAKAAATAAEAELNSGR
jgi:polysaccharide export outer membrane protein/exopolysaccharide production protein ExoF